jgi:hypothetical protein
MMQVEVLERRKLRSNQSRQAAKLLIESLADSHALRLLTLADASGLPLSVAGSAVEAEVLAAYAPLLSRTLDAISRESIVDNLCAQIDGITWEQISVRSFDINGDLFYLIAVGAPGATKDIALYRAITGCRRILGG